MFGKFLQNQIQNKPPRCYLVDNKFESVPLTKVLSQKSKGSLLDSQNLQLLADLIRKGLQKAIPIISQMSRAETPKKIVESIMDFSQKYKDIVDYQILRMALLAIAFSSLKVATFSPKQADQQKLIELLVSFNVHRLLYSQISEAQYFKIIIKLTESDFIEDDFAVLNSICKNPQQQILSERYQYLQNKPFSQGPRSYLEYKLMKLPNLAIQQPKLLQLKDKNKEDSIDKGQNNSLNNEKMQKHFGKQYLFKSKLKYQLGLRAKLCLDDLMCVDIKEIKDDQDHWQMYNNLKNMLIEKLSKQSSSIEQAEVFCKFGMVEQLVSVISHVPGVFQLNHQEVEQLRYFVEQQNQEEHQQEVQYSDNNLGEEQVPVMVQEVNQRIENENERKVKILNIVGGGIKGLFALLMLAEMQYRTGRHVYDNFDFFVGTSIGGIIIACLASRRYTAKQLLIKILGKAKNQIFHNLTFGNGQIGKIFQLICNIFTKRNSVYLEQNIREVCYDLIGDISLSDTNMWKNFLVTSVVQQDNQFVPCFFYKYNHQKGANKVTIAQNNQINFQPLSGLGQVKLWQILRATSAAFPLLPYILINGKIFLDGGFMFNNPSLIAISFLNRNLVSTESIRMLMIQLSCNKIRRNFNLYNIINEQSQLLGYLVKSSLLDLKKNVKKVIQKMEWIGKYCSQQTIRRLGHNVIHFDLYCSFLHKRITELPQLQLDHVDFQSIRTFSVAAQLLIKEMDRNNDFNRICLLFQGNDAPLEYNQSFIKARNISRYQTYKSSYDQLDRLFRDGILISTESDLVQQLESFCFPYFIGTKEKTIQLSRRIKKIPFVGGWFKEEPLAYALAIGHYPSINHYLQNQSRISSRHFKNDWNAYHICIANDQFLSLHALITKQLLSQQYANPSSRAIDAAINAQLRRNTLLRKIQQLNDILNNKGDAGLLLWNKISGRAFIQHFNAYKVKRYLQELNIKFQRQINQENLRADMWQILLE